MVVAVIGGTGKEGFGLAVRWARAGQHVIIGSRSPQKAREAAARARSIGAGEEIAGLPNREAAAAAEIVVLTIPYSGQAAILKEIQAVVRGKVVVDTTVPLLRYSPPELEILPTGSSAQQVQASLTDARVVAALHSVSSVKLNRFDEPLDGDVLACGDDATAKATVGTLIEALGMRPLDAGGLAEAATLERLGALIIGMNQRYKRKAIGVRFTGL